MKKTEKNNKTIKNPFQNPSAASPSAHRILEESKEVDIQKVENELSKLAIVEEQNSKKRSRTQFNAGNSN